MRKPKGRTKARSYTSGKTSGVNIHSCLAATAGGLAPGLLDQTPCSRKEAKDESRSHGSKKSRVLREKESFRRVKALETSAACLPETVKPITVCGREGDIYGLSDAAQTGGHLFLVRTAQNRMAAGNLRILDSVRKKCCMGKVKNNTGGFPP